MLRDLDAQLMQWLMSGGEPLRQVIRDEVRNRINYYPVLQSALQSRPIDIQRLANAVKECWVFHRSRQLRFRLFIEAEAHAQGLITRLLDELPAYPEAMARHIDEFITEAVTAGFWNEKHQRDYAGAATFASLLLTAYYPAEFVDYPSTSRWADFVARFGYEMPLMESYGKRLLWVSDFGKTLAKQASFSVISLFNEPMWVASGLCWSSGRTDYLDQLSHEEQTSESDLAAFACLSPEEKHRIVWENIVAQPERRARQASYYVRSRQIVLYALERAAGVCEGCGRLAPFVKPSGEPFLEVHHMHRLADGGPDRPDAVAALCPNCHRRAHHAHDAEDFNVALQETIVERDRSFGASLPFL